jgi:hypothetical protein
LTPHHDRYDRAQADALDIESFRIGWAERNRKLEQSALGVRLELKMGRIANVAAQVPASACLRATRHLRPTR